MLTHAAPRLLDRLRVRWCAVVGYSLGGRLALQLAAQDPHRFWAVCSLGGNPVGGLSDPRMCSVTRVEWHEYVTRVEWHWYVPR